MTPAPSNDPTAPKLTLLSVVIPARDEEGCIASTVEHLHVELKLRGVPHEIIVVDDGSSDGTWKILGEVAAKPFDACQLAQIQALGQRLVQAPVQCQCVLA